MAAGAEDSGEQAEGLASSNQSQDLESAATESITLVSNVLSLGQGCSVESGPCDATLSCVDGRCRVPCAGADDCAGLGEGVTCAVGVALGGLGVGACTYAAYCDPAHPSAPVSGAEPCSEGEGCAPSTAGSSACQPQPGSAELGGACLDDINCAPGLFCGEYGTCRRYCLDDADCAGGVCSPFVPARRAGDLSVGFCAASTQCDPAHPHSPRDGASTCPADAGCSPSKLPDGVATCVARNPSGGARYDPCSAGSDCQPGLFCGTGNLAGVCNAYCTTDDDCPGGGCWAFATPEFALGGSIGFCGDSCNPVAPDSSDGGFTACPPGFGCAVRADGASSCRKSGSQSRYEACESSVECGPGLLCTENGYCRPYCLSDGDCSTGRCNLFDDGRRVLDIPVGGCSEVCNPVAPSVSDDTFSACPQGFRCGGAAEDGLSTCSPAGTGGYGTLCEDSLACAPGFYCGTSPPPRCRKYCFDASDCESGTCNSLGNPTYAADRPLGFCSDP